MVFVNIQYPIAIAFGFSHPNRNETSSRNLQIFNKYFNFRKCESLVVEGVKGVISSSSLGLIADRFSIEDS